MSATLPEHIAIHLPALRRWCLYRERSRNETLQKINALISEIAPQESRLLIELLEEERYIDDRRFAAQYVQGKHRRNHWGRTLIRHGLRKAGISDDMIADAIDSLTGEEYLRTLERLLDSKAASIGYDGSLQARDRLYRYATGKGYESDLVLRVIGEIGPI